jgi:hypothetical protein
MRFTIDKTQTRITGSLIMALAFVVLTCVFGVGEIFRDSSFLMRLFLLFLGAILVGAIIAVQVIPGIVTLDGMMKGISSLSRKKARDRQH